MKPKYQPLQAPKSKQEIANQLKWLSRHMDDIATSMFMLELHSQELSGAAELCREWADEIEKECEMILQRGSQSGGSFFR